MFLFLKRPVWTNRQSHTTGHASLKEVTIIDNLLTFHECIKEKKNYLYVHLYLFTFVCFLLSFVFFVLFCFFHNDKLYNNKGH